MNIAYTLRTTLASLTLLATLGASSTALAYWEGEPQDRHMPRQQPVRSVACIQAPCPGSMTPTGTDSPVAW